MVIDMVNVFPASPPNSRLSEGRFLQTLTPHVLGLEGWLHHVPSDTEQSTSPAWASASSSVRWELKWQQLQNKNKKNGTISESCCEELIYVKPLEKYLAHNTYHTSKPYVSVSYFYHYYYHNDADYHYYYL